MNKFTYRTQHCTGKLLDEHARLWGVRKRKCYLNLYFFKFMESDRSLQHRVMKKQYDYAMGP